MSEKGSLFFDIDSRLLFELGENLVTNRAIALSELVKNSYDADATEAIVRMKNTRKPGGTIIVEDNGTGMSLSRFKKTWMRIATIDKEENPFSQIYKRKKAGKKGIGRFACRRLSKRLILKSVSEKSDKKEELRAVFEWLTFIPGSDVNEIPVEYSSREVDKDTSTGTVLILEDTNEGWTEWNIRELRNELSDLISPATFKSDAKTIKTEYDPGFRIEFECPEFPTKDKPLDAEFFKNAWTELTGHVNKEGESSYEIEVINKIINKRGRVFKRQEKFKHLKNTDLKVYIFSYRPDLFKKSEWAVGKARKIGGERGGIKVYADKFRVFGYGGKGDDWLRLDYDRARSLIGVDEEVSGFSEDKKQRPGLRLFRNHHLFGHVVFKTDDNPALEITANRERLKDNEAFEELRKFVRLGIDFATVLYANEIDKEKKEEKERKRLEEEARRKAEEEAQIKIEEAKKKAEERAARAEEARNKAEERAVIAEEERKKAEAERKKAEEARRKAEQERRKAEEEARKTKEEREEEKAEQALKKEEERIKAEEEARLKEERKREEEKEAKKRAEEARRRAEKTRRKEVEEKEKAEEKLLELKSDEIRKERQKYEEEYSRLRVLASTGTLVLIFEHELQALIEDMEEMISSFSMLLKQLPDEKQSNYGEILQSFSNRTEMIKELGEFLGITVGRESRLEKKEWVLFPIVESVFRPFRWYFKESGVEHKNSLPDYLRTPKMYRSELVSILHNLMSNAFKAVKGEKDRRVEVKGFEKDGNVHIQVLDSGKGLDKDLWEQVFEPFESYSEPDLRFGIGTGLGLKIVRDFVRSYGGEVKFVNAPKNWKTCIEVILPLEG